MRRSAITRSINPSALPSPYISAVSIDVINDAQQKWDAPAPDKVLVFRRVEKRDALIDRRYVKFVGNGMARIIGFVFALGHHDLLMMHVLVGDLLEQMMDAV